jgi:hypothetical protein
MNEAQIQIAFASNTRVIATPALTNAEQRKLQSLADKNEALLAKQTKLPLPQRLQPWSG